MKDHQMLAKSRCLLLPFVLLLFAPLPSCTQSREEAQPSLSQEETAIPKACIEGTLASIADIAHNPGLYKGKTVILKGWAWGFMAKPPKCSRHLPTAKGNIPENRSWGTLEDGTASCFLPTPPRASGFAVVCAEVVTKGGNWMLKPLGIWWREGASSCGTQ